MSARTSLFYFMTCLLLYTYLLVEVLPDEDKAALPLLDRAPLRVDEAATQTRRNRKHMLVHVQRLLLRASLYKLQPLASYIVYVSGPPAREEHADALEDKLLLHACGGCNSNCCNVIATVAIT